MTENEIMEDSDGEESEPTYRFHPDPAVDSIMSTVSDQAEYYRLANSVLTGKYDQPFTEWLANPTGVEMGKVENIPNVEKIVEWMHLDANLASLLEFKNVLDKLAKELHLAIFGKYASKNVRGSVHHKLEDLRGLRQALITMLDGTLVTCANVPMLQAVTLELLESIPAVGKQKPFGDGMVWNFPDAPNPERSITDKAAALHGTNLRSNNSTVKFVVDGKFPEEDSNVNLGALCAKYFSQSTQDVGKLFDGWAKEYFAAGDETPEKGVERDGKRYWLTVMGK